MTVVSGYGKIGVVPKEDAQLTHVGIGTPMGELLRRYWQPVCLSSEIDELPKLVKILGEELVAFRDKRGRVGVLDAHCAHRGTSLEYGRIEEEGIRCCYHGWLFSVEGRCLQQPGEPPESRYKDKCPQPAYPALEYGGLVFAYMGPPDKKPEFPLYDNLLGENVELVGYRNVSRGAIAQCNWLQLEENAMDPIHTAVLHSGFSGVQFTDIYSIIPQIGFQETEFGMKYVRTAKLPNGRTFVREQDVFVPNARSVADNITPADPHSQRSTLIGWWVPVDDTHTLGFHVEAVPTVNGKRKPSNFLIAQEGRTSGTQESHRSYEDTQRYPDDKQAQESQRPIAVHALEHLGVTDRGVTMFRNLLRRALRALAEGQDPQGVIRDPEKRVIRVVASNTVD
jgi:phenylpropionate dioxygenase-like ring-hydroxylating dioxygenase large terminal subunit